ncbi:hypothetical protein ONE63_011291 [Megalurothrips usitatus]|uniref:Glutathione S-transferase 1-like n=1 Tax=Megalurothrips usitatus TaxID=439358 RepID=A0AAV7X2P6_9NEOP|nr:hypothetical protein ONE63_011291 [Megalurothrips usitatus]
MVLTLYGTDLSPPTRAVRLVCAALGVDYEYKLISLLAGEHKKPEFLKINPHHTVPTIQDDDFALWDSHAIAVYLAEKSGNHTWYPKDARKRATIHQRLHFDDSMLFTKMKDVLVPLFYGTASEFQAEKVQRLQESLDQLDLIISDGGWLVGSTPTIADCCAAASVSSIMSVLPQLAVTGRTAAWLSRCERELPGYATLNTPGAVGLGQAAQQQILKRKSGSQ